LALLTRARIGEAEASRLNRLARGHPLALQLATSTALERPQVELREVAVQRIIDVLARTYLDDIADPLTRRTLEAAAVTRRATRSLLAALLPDTPPNETFARLRELPFVELSEDGLFVHDAVRDAVAGALRA